MDIEFLFETHKYRISDNCCTKFANDLVLPSMAPIAPTWFIRYDTSTLEVRLVARNEVLATLTTTALNEKVF